MFMVRHCVEDLTEIDDYKVNLFFGVVGFESVVERDDELTFAGMTTTRSVL